MANLSIRMLIAIEIVIASLSKLCFTCYPAKCFRWKWVIVQNMSSFISFVRMTSTDLISLFEIPCLPKCVPGFGRPAADWIIWSFTGSFFFRLFLIGFQIAFIVVYLTLK